MSTAAPTFGRILIPLDGTTLAESALPYSESLARSRGATLILVRAAAARALPGADPRPAQMSAITDAEEYLRALAANLRERGATVETAVPYGQAAGWILDEVRIRRADVVVMATHARRGFDWMMHGSVAESVLSQANVPVLLVRPWVGEELAKARAMADQPRILVSLDGSAFSEAALSPAASFAEEVGGRIILVQAVPVPAQVLVAEDGTVVSYLDQQEQAFKREATDYLHQIVARLSASHPSVAVETVVQTGPPGEAIADEVNEQRASLVVMATHGRTGLGRVLVGSVAGEVLRRAAVPLLLVRPSKLAPSVVHVEPPAQAAAVLTPGVPVTLTAAEIALLQSALASHAQVVTRQDHLQGPIHELQDRLKDAGTAAPSEPALR